MGIRLRSRALAAAFAAFAAAAAGCRPFTGPAAEVAQGSLGPPPQAELQVSFLDVGQGDSELIQIPGGGAVLIDGGPPEAGPKVLDDLRRAGVKRLDWVIGSHPHSDHIGGLVDVLRALPVDHALDSGYNHGTSLQRTYLSLLKSGGVRTEKARAGASYVLGAGARLEILAPEEPLLTGTDSDANNNSIVARLSFGSKRFLFTGDMEAAERRQLLKSASPEELHADVLKVAHHGSHNGTDAEFLSAVRPTYAVISCATQNDYGHPHREALQALQNAGVRVFRTDEQGTVIFASNGRNLEVKTQGSTAFASPQATQPPPSASSSAATESGPAAPKGPAAREQRVIGNRESKVFHSPDCPSLPRPERRMEFSSAAEARRAGYRPHAACLGGP